MSEYLILAETVLFKNNKLTCINVYDKFTSVAMPAEFNFDMAILCGPNWSVGNHHLTIKAKASNGKEIPVGELDVNIPNEDFVYNAYANNLKIVMDYSVENLTFIVCDGEQEILSRKYLVAPILIPQKQEEQNQENQEETVNV